MGQGNANSIYDFEGAQKTWKALQEFAKKEAKVFIPIPIQNINVVALPKRSVYYPSITQGNKGLATNCN